MFDVSHPLRANHPDGESAGHQQASARTIDNLMPRMTASGERIYLARGSAQSRFEPPCYYYEASKTGVVPSWVADEACKALRARQG